MVACVSSLEEELKKVQKESAVLQQEKASLSQQLSSLHGQVSHQRWTQRRACLAVSQSAGAREPHHMETLSLQLYIGI